jgi:sortase B
MKSQKYGKIETLLLILAVFLGITVYLITDKIHFKDEMSELQDAAYGSSSSDGESGIESTVDVSTEITLASTYDASAISSSANTNSISNITNNSMFTDIKALQDVNPDIFAWIKVPGTNIDYPVVQHPTNDEFYLKHGADGMKSSYGCPFIEICDSKNLDDFNTIIYGHNMNDGSMFAGLHKFEDRKFFNDHRIVQICTANHVYSYEIFAAVMYSDVYIPYYYDDMVVSDRKAFLDSLKTDIVPKRSIISEDIKVSEKNKIITLSTCDKKLRNNRFIVAGVLRQIDGQDV